MTSCGWLDRGSAVNLERPRDAGSRFGGHFVQGHVDAVGRVADVRPDDTPEAAGGARVRVDIPTELMRYVVEKGSITIDGVSLTVAEVHADGITTALIPHTLAVTTFGQVTPGDPVNLEVDVIAKYVERLMTHDD